jgi:hypothetical protein
VVARANDVIDYYLNGAGSYWDAGPRKSLQETIDDLQKFKNQVIASKQFADDPHSIMDAIIELIGKSTEQVERTIRHNEGSDSIATPPPDTDDPIHVPGVTNNSAQPISLPMEGKQPAPLPPVGRAPGTSSSKPVRTLSRRSVEQSPASAFDAVAPAAFGRQDSFGGRFGNWTSSPEDITPRNPNLPVSPSVPGRPFGIFTGKPMPPWTTPLPLGGLLNNSNGSGNDDWLTALGGLLWDGKRSRVP